MPGSMVYRLRISEIEAPHLVAYRRALREMQARLDNKSYNWIAGIHGAPNWQCWHHQRNPHIDLQARLFLPWHRAYLYEFEKLLQEQVDKVALPWWNWATDQAIPKAYTAATADGTDNPLRRYRMVIPPTRRTAAVNRFTRRQPAGHPLARLPTPRAVDYVLALSDFASFNDTMESLHDMVHGWVGGDMASVDTAAYDPIFFAHHCMIDRLWYLWQKRHGNGDFPAEFLDLPLPPFNRRVADVIEVQALGYEYAGQAVDILLGD